MINSSMITPRLVTVTDQANYERSKAGDKKKLIIITNVLKPIRDHN